MGTAALRVLFATDGSPAAKVAGELVNALAWSPGTTIRVVHAIPVLRSLTGIGSEARARIPLDEAARPALRDLAATLRREGVTVEHELLRGDAVAELIVDEARRWGADLVVTGSRGHGPISSMLLGSVAAAVTDHAPCPVLVARRPSLARIVFAEDGSPSAFEARRVLSTWSIFRGLPLRVTSVAHVLRPLLSGIAPTVLEEAKREQAAIEADARASYGKLANESAEQLRLAGVLAQGEVRSGDPAAEILAAAVETNADLIVMGSRGRSGLVRLLLGSVARNVLLHAACSVLIVRAKA